MNGTDVRIDFLWKIRYSIGVAIKKRKERLFWKNIENRADIEYNWYILMDMG